jgi:lysyl-tRNA synthetase class 1
MHWADVTAGKIIRERRALDGGEKELYTCASGITPSGTVHIGNFREIISVDLVVRALRDLGKNVRFIYSWDDYDVFRKVPLNMPQPEMLTKYLRFPITMVPDPWGRDTSYARHHEVDIETMLPVMGIHPEFLYQADRYRDCFYADYIKIALENKDKLKDILNYYRDDEHKIQGVWWPVSVFCSECEKDTTEIDGWDGDWGLSYHCTSCGKSETVDIRHAPGVKLPWRVDWPMRWAHEHTDFEPAGKDHHSQGGSFDTSRLVSKQIYDWEAPVTFRYDFIGIKGNAGKMSSSSGRVITIEDLLRVYTPEVSRFLFAGTRPNTEFTISFDLDVIKIYEDYDRTERIALGLVDVKNEDEYKYERRIWELSQPDSEDIRVIDSHVKAGRPPIQVPFRHLCNLMQIHDGDIEATLKQICEYTSHGELEKWRENYFRARLERAWYWVNECAPEDFQFRLRKEKAAEIEPCVMALKEQVIEHLDEFADDKACSTAIYAAAESAGVDPKALFKAAYQALIGKDQGPRLANFLRTIGKKRLLELL